MYVLFKQEKVIGPVLYGAVKQLMAKVRYFKVQGSKIIYFDSKAIRQVEIESLAKVTSFKPEPYPGSIEDAQALFPEPLHKTFDKVTAKGLEINLDFFEKTYFPEDQVSLVTEAKFLKIYAQKEKEQKAPEQTEAQEGQETNAQKTEENVVKSPSKGSKKLEEKQDAELVFEKECSRWQIHEKKLDQTKINKLNIMGGMNGIKASDFVAVLVHFNYVMLYEYVDKTTRIYKLPENYYFISFGDREQQSKDVVVLVYDKYWGRMRILTLSWKGFDPEKEAYFYVSGFNYKTVRTLLFKDHDNFII